MLSGNEVKKDITVKIHAVLGNIDLKRFHFQKGDNGSPEGIYIFQKEKQYHWVIVEKGRVREDKVVSLNEILHNIVESVAFDIALEYAVQNQKKGEDFRRNLFKKELEIHTMFGFGEEKKREIQDILKRNPYNDC